MRALTNAKSKLLGSDTHGASLSGSDTHGAGLSGSSTSVGGSLTLSTYDAAYNALSFSLVGETPQIPSVNDSEVDLFTIVGSGTSAAVLVGSYTYVTDGSVGVGTRNFTLRLYKSAAVVATSVTTYTASDENEIKTKMISVFLPVQSLSAVFKLTAQTTTGDIFPSRGTGLVLHRVSVSDSHAGVLTGSNTQAADLTGSNTQRTRPSGVLP